MYCKNTELERHNAEVDSPEKVLEMILKLQPDFNLTADNKCSSAYGKTSATPCLSSEQGFCLSSSSAKEKAYDCDEIPYPLHQKKARLCYCKQGTDSRKYIATEILKFSALPSSDISFWFLPQTLAFVEDFSDILTNNKFNKKIGAITPTPHLNSLILNHLITLINTL